MPFSIDAKSPAFAGLLFTPNLKVIRGVKSEAVESSRLGFGGMKEGDSVVTPSGLHSSPSTLLGAEGSTIIAQSAMKGTRVCGPPVATQPEVTLEF